MYEKKELKNFLLCLFFFFFIYASINDKWIKEYNKARIYIEKGKYKKAEKILKKLIKYKLNIPEIYMSYGYIYEQYYKNYEKAIENYVHYYTIVTNEELKEQTGRLLKNFYLLKFPLTKKIKKARSYFFKALKLYKKRNIPQALLYFEKSLKIAPYSQIILYYTGLCNYILKRYDKAIIYFEKAEKFKPLLKECRDLYFYLGILYDDIYKKDYEKSLYYYGKYKSIKGDKVSLINSSYTKLSNLNYLYLKAKSLIRSNNLAGAKQILSEAQKIKRADVRILNLLAYIYVQENNLKKADKLVDIALTVRKDYGANYINKARIYVKKNNFKLARNWLLEGRKYFTDYDREILIKDKIFSRFRYKRWFKRLLKR